MVESLVTTIEQRRSGARVIRFAGVLDEHNQLGELLDKVGAGTTLINLAELDRINSSGVRDWMTWLGRLQAKGTKPVLIACSPAVVAQLNRIKNFAGEAIVKSFQLPYACAPCNIEKRVLVHVIDKGEPPYNAPEHACDACGNAMTAAVDQHYFAFLASQPKLTSRDTPMPTETPVPAELARGSRDGVSADHVKRVSKPQMRPRASVPSLSAFQLPQARNSEHDLHTRPPTPPPDSRPYIIAVLALLLCAVGVLGFLLLA
jgi:anti-anti-sigma regulatory factor